MKLFGRQDVLLIGALTAALIVVFSSTISRVLAYVRWVERQTGLTLMPALAVLVAALVFHLLRRHFLNQAKTAAAEAATKAAQQRAEELERLVAFGQALGRALDFDAIRVAIGHHLRWSTCRPSSPAPTRRCIEQKDDGRNCVRVAAETGAPVSDTDRHDRVG